MSKILAKVFHFAFNSNYLNNNCFYSCDNVIAISGKQLRVGRSRKCPSRGASPTLEHQRIGNPLQKRNNRRYRECRNYCRKSQRHQWRTSKSILLRCGFRYKFDPSRRLQRDGQANRGQSSERIQWDHFCVWSNRHRENLHDDRGKDFATNERNYSQFFRSHFRSHR